jgi:hypothetical protein
MIFGLRLLISRKKWYQITNFADYNTRVLRYSWAIIAITSHIWKIFRQLQCRRFILIRIQKELVFSVTEQFKADIRVKKYFT